MIHDIRLGYLGFEVRDLAVWESFAVDVLGLQVGSRGEGALDLRCDERGARFFLTEGPDDDVAVFGWEVDDDAALDALTERLLTAGVDVHPGSDDEARRRGVTRLMKLHDPTGHPLELFHGSSRAAAPFASRHVVSSFVTGVQGLGHVVVSAAEPGRSMAFYRDLLGFRLSDRIACDLHGYAVDITFFHGGPRHHAVA
ncbi:MAG TPA: VOC family protein, partial [Polyangiaceae bacterium]|nr:VOC family protein [Polyangiaceae bacterium]